LILSVAADFNLCIILSGWKSQAESKAGGHFQEGPNLVADSASKQMYYSQMQADSIMVRLGRALTL
jgi:hypothetical protein